MFNFAAIAVFAESLAPLSVSTDTDMTIIMFESIYGTSTWSFNKGNSERYISYTYTYHDIVHLVWHVITKYDDWTSATFHPNEKG